MRKWKPWAWSFVNAFVMLALSVWWMNAYHAYGDEIGIVKWSSVVRNILFDHSPPKDQLLFIDLSHDKSLIESETGLGNDVLTDRHKLSIFLNRIKQSESYKFILFDVLLSGQTDVDGELRNSLKDVKRICAATHFNEDQELEVVNFPIPIGITSYNEINNGFLKFELIQDSVVPTLPVQAYQKLTGRVIKQKWIFNTDDHRLCFNTIINDQQIDEFTVFTRKKYPIMRLSELLGLTDAEMKVAVNGRIIVLGDFENDRHETAFGSTAGALVLVNILWSLMNQRHLISWFWVGGLLVAFTLLSKIVLYHHTPYRRKSLKWIGPLIKTTIFLLVISVFSYMVFGRQIQIMFLTVYLNALRLALILTAKPPTWLHLKASYQKFKNYLET